MRCIKGGIIGGIILFLWGMVSWLVLSWHMTTMNGFKDEQAVASTIQSNVLQSGIYIIPLEQMKTTPEATQTPLIFASVHLEGTQSMVIPSLIGLVNQIVAAILVAWLLTKTSGLGYFGRVGFVIVFALAVGVISQVPYWNWFAFDPKYTLVMIADLLIGWFLAGLVLAKICQPS